MCASDGLKDDLSYWKAQNEWSNTSQIEHIDSFWKACGVRKTWVVEIDEEVG